MTGQTTNIRPSSLETIISLLRNDTTSRLPTGPVVGTVAAFCAAHKLHLTRQPSENGAKENILITLPDRGGGTAGGVMLSGHLDTVPVDDQNWSSPPFTPQVRGTRLYARGAADMKAFCGTVLAALPSFAAAPLSMPLHVTFTYDEETGCAGARGLLSLLEERGIRPRICIVGEPTRMKAIVGHKGCRRATLLVRGVAGHSSLAPLGVNAVEYAGRIVAYLAGLSARLEQQGPFDHAFTIPHTTLSVGIIKGGTEPNIIPDRCEVQFEIRPVPAQDTAALDAEIAAYLREIEQEMIERHPDAGLSLTHTVDVPSLTPHADNAAVTLFETLTRTPVDESCVAYGTEAGLFQSIGIDTIVCGPGSIDQAHIADEFIDLDQILRLEAFLDALRTELQQPSRSIITPKRP